MKKVFTSLHTFFTLPVVLAGTLAIGAGAALAETGGTGNQELGPNIEDTVPFIPPAQEFVSRLGSLAVGHTVVPSWIITQSNYYSMGYRCLHINFDPKDALKAQSCLDVNGSAVFPRLVVRSWATVLGNVAVGGELPEDTGKRVFIIRKEQGICHPNLSKIKKAMLEFIVNCIGNAHVVEAHNCAPLQPKLNQMNHDPDKFRGKYRIPETRWKGFDYGYNAMYFVTICTKDRIIYFGEIIGKEIRQSE